MTCLFIGKAHQAGVSVPVDLLHDPEPVEGGAAEGGGHDEAKLLRVPPAEGRPQTQGHPRPAPLPGIPDPPHRVLPVLRRPGEVLRHLQRLPVP